MWAEEMARNLTRACLTPKMLDSAMSGARAGSSRRVGSASTADLRDLARLYLWGLGLELYEVTYRDKSETWSLRWVAAGRPIHAGEAVFHAGRRVKATRQDQKRQALVLQYEQMGAGKKGVAGLTLRDLSNLLTALVIRAIQERFLYTLMGLPAIHDHLHKLAKRECPKEWDPEFLGRVEPPSAVFTKSF